MLEKHVLLSENKCIHDIMSTIKTFLPIIRCIPWAAKICGGNPDEHYYATCRELNKLCWPPCTLPAPRTAMYSSNLIMAAIGDTPHLPVSIFIRKCLIHLDSCVMVFIFMQTLCWRFVPYFYIQLSVIYLPVHYAIYQRNCRAHVWGPL